MSWCQPVHTMINIPAFNPDQKYVRVIETHANGLVEFEFAVGEPELFVELMMTKTAFDEFCAMHQVTPTNGPLTQVPDCDTQEWDWSLRAAREQQLRHDTKA